MFNQMPYWLSLAGYGHIIGGVIALLIFTLPLFSRKGGKFHVRTGWVYAFAMILVSVSAFLITPWRYFIDPLGTDKSRTFSYFLFFIALFSLASLQQGVVVFRYKQRTGKNFSLNTIVFPLVLAIFSALTLVWGTASKNWLFIIFGIFAASTAWKQIRYWKLPPVHPKDWWFFHLEMMFNCCISTVTAFGVTAVPRLLPVAKAYSIWIWLAPTIIMVPWMIWFRIKYQKQFGLRK